METHEAMEWARNYFRNPVRDVSIRDEVVDDALVPADSAYGPDGLGNRPKREPIAIPVNDSTESVELTGHALFVYRQNHGGNAPAMTNAADAATGRTLVDGPAELEWLKRMMANHGNIPNGYEYDAPRNLWFRREVVGAR